MARYLVTGGAGFIGSNLVDELIARGHDVVVIDDLSAGSRTDVHPRAQFAAFDCGNPEKLFGFLGSIAPFDGIFHLASSVGVRKICLDPAGTSRNIVCAAESIVRWRLQQKTRPRLVMVSSSEVYGNRGGLLYENLLDGGQYPLTGARWSYAAAKRITESMDPEAIVARLFNCVGIRQGEKTGMVVPSFIGRAIRGEDLFVHDPDHYRSFCAVSDTVSGLITLMESGVPGEAYNVGNDSAATAMTIMELARAVVRLSESGSEILIMEPNYPGWSPLHERYPSVKKLRALGWAPQKNEIDEILQPLIAHCREAAALLT